MRLHELITLAMRMPVNRSFDLRYVGFCILAVKLDCKRFECSFSSLISIGSLYGIKLVEAEFEAMNCLKSLQFKNPLRARLQFKKAIFDFTTYHLKDHHNGAQIVHSVDNVGMYEPSIKHISHLWTQLIAFPTAKMSDFVAGNAPPCNASFSLQQNVLVVRLTMQELTILTSERLMLLLGTLSGLRSLFHETVSAPPTDGPISGRSRIPSSSETIFSLLQCFKLNFS
jgi:hypothetical protein